MTAAFAGGHRVDFIDDHRARGAEHFSSRLRTEQHVERFRGGHQNVRRGLAHGRAFFLRGVASAHGGGDCQPRQIHLPQVFGDPRQWVLQVDANVVGKRLQWRDVDHQGFVGQAVGIFQASVDEVVEHGQKRSEGFAGAGGRGDQRRTALADQRPCAGLGGGDRRECVAEPGTDGGVKACQGRVRGDGQIHGLSYAGAGVKMQVPFGPHREQAHSYRGMHFNCRSEPARDGASRSATNIRDVHFTDDGCALNPQNATIPAITNDIAWARCR
ncbi:hypothetical protein D3C86_512160 [compost metagenome]